MISIRPHIASLLLPGSILKHLVSRASIAQLTLLLLVIGALAQYSVGYYESMHRFGDPLEFFARHMVRVLLGATSFIVLARIPIARVSRLAALSFLASITLVLLMIVVGEPSRGATRWIRVGALTISPTAALTLACVIYWPRLLTDPAQGPLRAFLQYLSFLLPTATLLFLPNLGAAVILLVVQLALFSTAGFSGLPSRGAAVTAVAPWAAFVWLRPDLVQRAMRSLTGDPIDSGWQSMQAQVAVGSGGLLGVGFGRGIMKCFFLPEAHTDFVFAALAEELGFVGCILILGLYAVLVMRGLVVASRAQSRYAQLVAIAISLHLGVCVLTNVLANLGLIPAVGTPLPLISYAGSDILMNCALLGILARIAAMSDPPAPPVARRAPPPREITVGPRLSFRRVLEYLRQHTAFMFLEVVAVLVSLATAAIAVTNWLYRHGAGR